MSECLRPEGTSRTSAYTNQGCRCAECREAHAVQMRTNRAARIERARLDPSTTPHGTENGYQSYACRCPQCREARRLAVRRRADEQAKWVEDYRATRGLAR